MLLCCTPETNIILEIVYTSFNKQTHKPFSDFQFAVSLRLVLLSFKFAYGSRVGGRVEFWDVKGGVCENADSILRGLGA